MKYRLKKDLPWAKAGGLFKVHLGELYPLHPTGNVGRIPDTYKDSVWFEKVEEEEVELEKPDCSDPPCEAKTDGIWWKTNQCGNHAQYLKDLAKKREKVEEEMHHCSEHGDVPRSELDTKKGCFSNCYAEDHEHEFVLYMVWGAPSNKIATWVCECGKMKEDC